GVDGRAGQGDAQLFPRLFTHALQPGNAADGVERDVARADAEDTGHQRMAQFMQHHAAKHGEQKQDREERKSPAALRSLAEEDVSSQEQEAPVNVNAYAEGRTQFPGSEHYGVIFLIGKS